MTPTIGEEKPYFNRHTNVSEEPIEGRPSDNPPLRESQVEQIFGQVDEQKEGSVANSEDEREASASVLLKIIEIEKEIDLSRETLSILNDFSVSKLYELLTSAKEEKGSIEAALDKFNDLGFYEDFNRVDYQKVLNSISHSSGQFTVDEFK